MIHVCFGLHDADGRYSKFTGTTLTSIFENTTAEVTAHILHDSTLTDDNREKFLRLARRYNQCLKFYSVEQLCPQEILFLIDKLADKIILRFTIGAFYRLLIKKIFDLDKIIYLDSDIIVNLDIAELWQQDLQNFPVAAVPEIDATQNHMLKNKFILNAGIVKAENYFCSGVIVFNLDKLDENFFANGVQFLLDNPQCASPDQDILNALFSENYLKLAQKFDSFVETEDVGNAPAAQKIYHYAGHKMGFDTVDTLKRLWLKYFALSTWLDEEALGRLYEKFQAQDTQVKNLLINLTSALSGRKRAFVLVAEYLEPLKFVFGAKDRELIIIEKFKDTAQLIKTLKKSRSQKVFLAMLPNYPLLRDLLAAEGFIENKDFFDGTKFLSTAHGWRFDSYPFIKVL